MILSVSRRTDIPCFFAEWFYNRVREGYALTRNPMNHSQLYRVPISPDIVECIVFWTKDPANLLPYLPYLDESGYQYYFQFTLTPYGAQLEPGLRPKDEIISTFRELSDRIGKERIIWRYDPIILNGSFSISWHESQFRHMSELLAPYTDTVTVSFVDYYAKIPQGLIREITADEMRELGASLGTVAREIGISAVSCCESADLTPYGIERASCVDPRRIERICGYPLKIPRDRSQRPGCGCAESIDIGAYDTCPNGCAYCYANRKTAVLRRFTEHDPASPLLAGSLRDGEIVLNRAVKSYKSS